MLPAGTDVFTARPEHLKRVATVGRSALDATSSPEALRFLRKGFYVVDTQPAGTVSSIVRQIAANARAAADLAGRAEIEAGATNNVIRGIVDSRPLGGGW